MRHIYLAGPITGLTHDEAVARRDRVLENPLWDPEWIGLSPMRDKEHLRMVGPLPSTFDEADKAMYRDLNDIDRSDVVLLDLTGATAVSIGTMCELGYAYAKGKYIVVAMGGPHVVMTEESGWQKWVTNPHDHLFVNGMATAVVPSIDEALTKIKETENRGYLPYRAATRAA